MGAQSSGDSAIPGTAFATVAAPSASQTPCQHMDSVVRDLLLPDLHDRERTCSCRVMLSQVHRELPGGGSHQNGASHFPVHGSSWASCCGWMRAGEEKGDGEIMAALCQVDLNCWTKPNGSRCVSRASQGEEPE